MYFTQLVLHFGFVRGITKILFDFCATTDNYTTKSVCFALLLLCGKLLNLLCVVFTDISRPHNIAVGGVCDVTQFQYQ